MIPKKFNISKVMCKYMNLPKMKLEKIIQQTNNQKPKDYSTNE